MDEFNYQPKFGGGSDVYLKFNDWSENEQSYKIRIASPTYTRLEVRKGDERVDTSDWKPEDFKEAMNSNDYQISQKFGWVVLVRGEGEDKDSEAKVYEAGTGVWKKIQAIAQDPDWSPIGETDLKITRRGIKKDARYEVVPSPKNRGPITENEFAIADELQLTKFLPDSVPLTKFMEEFEQV